MLCPLCSKDISEGQVFCQHCGARLAPEFEAGQPAGDRRKTAWEDRETSGFFSGLFESLKDILLTPSSFFKKMPLTGGLADPLLYALIVGMAGLTLHYVWSILLYNPMHDFLTPEMRSAVEHNMIGNQGASLSAVVTPFILILWLFILTGFLNVILMMVNGARAGFEATFRVTCYSISPFVCLAIPWCGMPLTVFWAAILGIIGLKEAHRISGGKATFAVLFPLLFCCGLILLGIVLFMGAMAASFGSLMQLYQ